MIYPNLVVLDPSQPDPADKITIYFGEPGETELQNILFPDGPDGDPYLDPDTDGGDIMPDSIRIKEIHAALDAQRFAQHPDSTDENPKTNLRTLGRLLEATSRMLGVNFNADGENVPFPEPELFGPEKIEEINNKKLLKNAQFFVADMGGDLDTSSLYEVRSAIFNQTGKNDGEIDLRPHAIKYHNLLQLVDAQSDDMSKQLGGGKNSIFQVPNADGDNFQEYHGVFQGLGDALYMLSVHSKQINELENQSILQIHLLKQLLAALGLPISIGKIEGSTGIYDKEGKEKKGYMPAPYLQPASPTITSLFGIVLMNLQRLVASTIGYSTDQEPKTEAETQSLVEVTVDPQVVNPGGGVTFSITRTVNTQEAISIGYLLTGSASGSDYSGKNPGRGKLVIEKGKTSAAITLKIANKPFEEVKIIKLILEGGDNYTLASNSSATTAILPDEIDATEAVQELLESDWKLETSNDDEKPDFSGLNEIIKELADQLKPEA